MRKALRLLAGAVVSVAFVGLLWEFGRQAEFASWRFALWSQIFLWVWATFLQWLVPWHLPAQWLRPRSWECAGRFYRALGVPYVKRLLASPLWRRFNPDFQFSEKGKSALQQMEKAMDRAEANHLWAGAASLLLSAVLLMSVSAAAAWKVLLINFLANGYPVWVQRYNRARLWRALKKCGTPAAMR